MPGDSSEPNALAFQSTESPSDLTMLCAAMNDIEDSDTSPLSEQEESLPPGFGLQKKEKVTVCLLSLHYSYCYVNNFSD